jgi:hypothetical protein
MVVMLVVVVGGGQQRMGKKRWAGTHLARRPLVTAHSPPSWSSPYPFVAVVVAVVVVVASLMVVVVLGCGCGWLIERGTDFLFVYGHAA